MTLKPPGKRSTVQGGGKRRSGIVLGYSKEGAGPKPHRGLISRLHKLSRRWWRASLPSLVPPWNRRSLGQVPPGLLHRLDCVPISFSDAFMAMGWPYDLPYSVEQWDDADSHVEELIALTGDYRVARAAFEEAVKRRPGRIVTLRQKTRLLADSRRKI